MRAIALTIMISGLGIATLDLFHSELANSSHEMAPVIVQTSQEEVKKLDPKYCIHYGDPNSSIKVVEFFSFQCPHCIRLFKDDFMRIKEDFIDNGRVYFEFHPVPQDLPTAQAMICFEKLSDNEKRLFLEAILEEAAPSNPDVMTKLMMAAMKAFKKPLPHLEEDSFLKSHPAFEDMYSFLKQEKVLAVPTAQVNGHLFVKEVPDYQFIKSFIQD